ncbi:hypothetical protein V6N11_004068 [Hibiscus sabdariffa]|uniref:Uncharacterized protein n=1 Tax=Hibiscus sabdariffa TaxID=183260 RepID=A0ABR2SF50_9ROSI
MERSERTLVPEWLRSTGTGTGTGTGAGNSVHHFAFSSSSSDVSSLLHHGRHRNSRKITLIDEGGWTSALADVPSVVGSSSRGSLPAPQTVSTTSSGALSVMCGLNMAEALAQAPSWTRTAPLLSVTTQRREELAIKQSRQLIPVTPSMPKVLNSADKSKAKPAARISEMNIAVKSGSQAPPLIHQGWDNGVSSPTQNDIASPTTIANNRVATSQHAAAPVNSAPARNSNSPKIYAVERKVAAINPIPGFTVEKRSLAQTQSRNDFFNLLKKKTTTNTSGGLSDSDPQISSSTVEKSEVAKEVICDSATAHADDGTAATSNGDTCSDDSEKNMSATVMVYPDEEEAAFLRSLGWEENNGEDEGLTEEEINAFYQEYLKLRPSLKLCRDMQAKLSESVANNMDGASSESGTGSEA